MTNPLLPPQTDKRLGCAWTNGLRRQLLRISPPCRSASDSEATATQSHTHPAASVVIPCRCHQSHDRAPPCARRFSFHLGNALQFEQGAAIVPTISTMLWTGADKCVFAWLACVIRCEEQSDRRVPCWLDATVFPKQQPHSDWPRAVGGIELRACWGGGAGGTRQARAARRRSLCPSCRRASCGSSTRSSRECSRRLTRSRPLRTTPCPAPREPWEGQSGAWWAAPTPRRTRRAPPSQKHPPFVLDIASREPMDMHEYKNSVLIKFDWTEMSACADAGASGIPLYAKSLWEEVTFLQAFCSLSRCLGPRTTPPCVLKVRVRETNEDADEGADSLVGSFVRLLKN